MHDAAEAYTGDIIRPLKKMLAQSYFSIERQIEQAVCDKFGLTIEMFDAVKIYDDQALQLEFRAFYHQSETAKHQIKSLSSVRLSSLPAEPFWNPEAAKYSFLNTFHSIQNSRPILNEKAG